MRRAAGQNARDQAELEAHLARLGASPVRQAPRPTTWATTAR